MVAMLRLTMRLPPALLAASRGIQHLTPQPRRARCVATAASKSGTAASKSVQLRVTHLLLKAEDDGLLTELETRVAGGEPLGDLAAEHSICPSKKKAGDIGWIGRGRTVPEFEAAAFAAAPGEVVTVRSQFGWHLLQVTGQRQVQEVGRMTVQELAEALEVETAAAGSHVPSEEGDDFESDLQFVDVREEGEAAVASLPHFRFMPLSHFGEWSPLVKDILDPSKETVVLCHHGVRSMQMASFLVEAGFSRVRNVTGGIDAYSVGVDPSVPRY